MADQSQPTAAADVVRVAREVELRGIRLKELACELFAAPGSIPADWSKHVFFGVNSARERWDPADGVLEVRASFVAFYKTGCEPGEELPPFTEEDPPDFVIEAEFALEYEIASETEFADEEIDAFAEMNGTFNAWPYWRELVQSTSARLGVAPLVVPVYRPAASSD